MKDNSWEDELLNEVLGEPASPSFRADSLAQMLGAVRQRRQSRQRRIQALLTAFCLLASIGLLMRLNPKPKLVTANKAEPLLVHSKSLPSGMIVLTDPLLISTIKSSGSSLALV